MASNSSTPSTSNMVSTSNVALTNNMTVNESNFTESNVSMKISTQSRELPTNSITVQGNITNSKLNVQIITESMPREPSDFYGFPDLPETVNKRESDVENLREIMIDYNKVAITGIGGIGKTTLANLCARKWVEDGTYQHAIFVNIETEESASGVFKRLAEIVLNSKAYSESIIREIYVYYNKKKTLVILDNIEQNSLLSKYYPSKELTNIDILGTSQFTELKRRFDLYSLQVLSRDESFKLVMDIFKNNNIKEHSAADIDPVIYDLVVKLDSHPLALQHAAALVIDMYYYDKVPLEQCLNKYMEHFQIQLKQVFRTEHPFKYWNPVYAALSLNIEKATKGKEHVKSLLHCITYLDPAGIDIKILYKAFSTVDIQVPLIQLGRNSLISVHGDMVSMHRLVSQACHAMLTADDKITYLNIVLNTLFYYTDNHLNLSIKRHCSFLIENLTMNKEELAAYYKAAFYNNDQIKEHLTARLQMIDCVISDTEDWSVQQCCVFAGHLTFYEHFNGMGNTINQVDMFEVSFVQVIRDSSLYLFNNLELSILKVYEDNKKELNKPILKNLTILSICAAFGLCDYDFISLIDMGYDVNIIDNNGMTPILWAARNMSYDIVFILLQRSATCDVRYKEGLTAAAAGNSKSVLRLLRTSEVYNYTTGEYGKMLLWWAASNGHHDIVRELVQRGTDTSGADGRGNTLLHMVASGGYDGTVSQFIYSADANNTNSNGNTALILAIRHGHDKIVSELIGAKADVNIVGSNGDTALIVAARKGHDKFVSKLIANNADLNTVDSDGNTALILTADNGHDKITIRLAQAGANVNIANTHGNTALLFAAKHGDYELALELINRGARTDPPANNRGETPLSWAQRNGDDRMEHIISSKCCVDT